MDWTDTGYERIFHVNVVDQTNLDYTLGSLAGVKLDGLSITENYYSDSRVQAKVSTIVKETESDGYVKNARLRITMNLPGRGVTEELVTGYVTDISPKYDHGYVQRDYTIEGTIWGLLNHKTNAPITVTKGAKMKTIWSRLLSSLTKMQYNTSKADDYIFSKGPTVYEAGSNLGTILFNICSGHARMDVDGHGRIILVKYIEPSKQEPSRIIDMSDARGLEMYPLAGSSSEWEAPGRAVVTATISSTDKKGKTTQKVVVGSYDAPASHATSMATRGWLRGVAETYNGVSENPSKSELNAEAKKVWQNNQNKGKEWTIPSVYKGYKAGEVATLILPEDSVSGKLSGHKVLIQSVNTDLYSFTQELTLKEV